MLLMRQGLPLGMHVQPIQLEMQAPLQQMLPVEQQALAPVVGLVQAEAPGQHLPFTLTWPPGQQEPLEHI